MKLPFQFFLEEIHNPVIWGDKSAVCRRVQVMIPGFDAGKVIPLFHIKK